MFQSDAGRTACTRPSSAAAWPLVIEGQRLPRKVFRRSIALLSDSLSTLRGVSYLSTTQDSLPVAGQALLDGLSTRKLPMKGFRFVIYISFPSLKLTWRNRCNRCHRQSALSAIGLVYRCSLATNTSRPTTVPRSIIIWQTLWLRRGCSLLAAAA